MNTFFTAMASTMCVSPFGPNIVKENHNRCLMRLLSSCWK